MKDTIKKGILAGKILDSLSEDEKDILLEQAQEIKPSRINRSIKFNKKRKNKFDYEDYEY